MWLYKTMGLFNKERFKNVINFSDIKEKVYIKATDIKTGMEIEKNSYFVIIKDGEKYLLPVRDELKFPIYVSESTEVSHKEKVYKLITRYKEVKYKSVKHNTLRWVINNLSDREHTNPVSDRIMRFVGIASLLKNTNIRVCATRRFGKSSVFVQIELLKDCARIITPESLPGLIYYLDNRVLVFDEITTLNADNLRQIQKFALNACAGVPFYHRGKLPSDGSGKMTYDISNLSVVFCFNRKEELNPGDLHFEDAFNDAVCDRFFPLLLTGETTSTFETPDNIQDVYETQKEDMIKWAETLEYYMNTDNLLKELHNYKRNIDMSKYNIRWVDTWDSLMKVVDLYSNDQMEFYFWEEYAFWCFKNYIYQEASEKRRRKMLKGIEKVYIEEPICMEDFMKEDILKGYCDITTSSKLDMDLIKASVVLGGIYQPVREKEFDALGMIEEQ